MFLFVFVNRFDTPLYYMSIEKYEEAIAVLEKFYERAFI